MMFKELEKKIKSLVAKDEIADAIDLLTTAFEDHPVINDIILQSGRYHSLKKEQLNGTMDFDTIQTYLNQLRANILTFIHSQKDSLLFKEPAKNSKNTTLEGEYKFSLARISTLWLLTDIKQRENKLSISEICQLTNNKSRRFIVQTLNELEQNNLVEKISEGKRVYWRINEKGMALAKKMQEATLWKEV